MSTTNKLTKEELRALYLKGGFTEELQTEENLLALFQYEMSLIDEIEDGQENVEIISFCLDALEKYRTPISPYATAKNYANVMVKHAERNFKAKRKQSLKRILKVAGVAACFCFLFLSMGKAITMATGFELFKFSVNNREERISISNGRKALEEVFTVNSAPTWLPEGFSLVKEQANSTSYAKLYFYKDNFNNCIKFTIYNYDRDEDYVDVFETNGDVTKHDYNGKSYYLGSNMNDHFITWHDNVHIYQIYTSLSEDKLIEILEKNLN